MTQIDALVLVDCSHGLPTADLRARWKQSDFVKRVEALGDRVYFWANAAVDGPWDQLVDATSLDAALEACGANTIIWVDPTQVFLDVDLVLSGMQVFDPSFHDSFTQWEHCRLPVGVGVRALSARSWHELGSSSPADAWDKIRLMPAGRRFSYDVEHRVSYAESLLDSRKAWPMPSVPLTWDLAGFLDLAQAMDHGELRYLPEAIAPRVDERRMPVAYGFESEACSSFPTYVMFDITNICNARCIHCPQSLRDEEGKLPDFLRNQEHQNFEVFKGVIDECAEHDVRFVRITADGEPLVHPRLFDMLSYARDQGVGPVGLTTNGSLLTEERARKLIKSGVSVVDFSLDAFHPETFAKVRVGLDFEKTRANVLRFIELVKASGEPIKVMVSFVKQDSNVADVQAFKDYWGPRVSEVVVREMISNVGLNTPSTSSWPGWDARWPCAHFFRRVVINHQGMLKACPIDWEQRTVHEHIEKENVFSQWHGELYWRHRMQHLNDTFTNDSACKTCPDWAGTPWNMGYEKIIDRLTDAVETAQ